MCGSCKRCQIQRRFVLTANGNTINTSPYPTVPSSIHRGTSSSKRDSQKLNSKLLQNRNRYLSKGFVYTTCRSLGLLQGLKIVASVDAKIQIASFFLQVASNISKFCKCVKLCLRFKRTLSCICVKFSAFQSTCSNMDVLCTVTNVHIIVLSVGSCLR